MLKVKDTAADGHHAAIRVNTWDANLNAHTWSWHRNYGGSGSTETWNTYLNDTRGIRQVRIDVAVAEGSTFLYSCFNGGRFNPYYDI